MHRLGLDTLLLEMCAAAATAQAEEVKVAARLTQGPCTVLLHQAATANLASNSAPDEFTSKPTVAY